MIGYLVLENGQIFSGERIGYVRDAIFELVFNTSMSGYVEVLTDPSYVGQAVVFTYPLIGNYGIALADGESHKIWVEGVLVNELAQYASNFRKELSLNDFLIKNKVPGLQGINTRQLTKIIRDSGVMKAKIVSDISKLDEIIKEIKNYKFPDAVSLVSAKEIKKMGNGKIIISLLDFGVKQNIVKSLLQFDTTVYLFPSTTPIEKLLSVNPNGIVLSNGPGDPKTNTIAIETIKKLYESNIPILGICLGHQLLALATGADTKKLKYGHRGPNHPVKYYRHNRVYMTSQNHGYYIDEQTIDKHKVDITYLNVNDKTIEGLSYKNKNIETVQFHPEACAGPHDTAFIFDEFFKLLGK